jgi:hypothetical protein
MGEGWSDWFMMMQLKPGDSGHQKRGLTFVSSQATDGLELEHLLFY